MDTNKKVQLLRSPAREGIELVIGTDRVTLKLDNTVDDAEVESLVEFAQLVAQKCGKTKVIVRGKVERTLDGGFSTAIPAASLGA
jgi:hypothetical protein